VTTSARQRRVVFVCNGGWVGGPTVFLRRFCTSLPQHGWDCKLVLTGSQPSAAFLSEPWPCEVETTGASYSWEQLGRKTARILLDFCPEPVVGMAGLGACMAIRHLYSTGNSDIRMLDTVQLDVPFEYQRIRNTALMSTAVAAVSDACVARIKREIPQLADRAFRIWLPVPSCSGTPARSAADGRLRIAYVGRLAQWQKRILDFVPLAKELVSRGLDFSLTFVGEGPERGELERALTAMDGCAGRVSFLGQLSNEKALEVLREQDVLVLLSEAEGQPFVLLEAMISGVVPVVTDLPGTRELIVDGKTGFLVRPGDFAGFASISANLAGNRTQLANVAAAASRAVREKHEMRAAVGAFAELLATVSQMEPPDERVRAGFAYPGNRMQAWGVPQPLQGLKRRLLGQQVH